MSADLERKVREAAEQALDKKRSLLEWTDNAYLYGDGYRDGYLAAATLREEEIGELRALLREACGILNDAIKTDETFWLEEMRGTNEDLTERIMLMLPPTPVPETKA